MTFLTSIFGGNTSILGGNTFIFGGNTFILGGDTSKIAEIRGGTLRDSSGSRKIGGGEIHRGVK